MAQEDDFTRAIEGLENAMNCLRYGLMEFGGFVRNEVLSATQMAHMFTQERANFVLWNVQRNRAEDTDHVHSGLFNEDGEEEPITDDEDSGPTAGMENLMNSMRRDQNTALANERWGDASEIQQGIMVLLDASQGEHPRGMTMEVVTNVRNIFQRLWRRARNRGSAERADAYRRYVDDMHGIMRG